MSDANNREEDQTSGAADDRRGRPGWDSTPDNSNDSNYIYDGDDLSDDADGGLDDALPRQHRQYEIVGEYPTYEAALRALETLNAHIYTYETRYETNRRHARVYRCRSHVACDHRLKIISLVVTGDDLVYQLTEGGMHSSTVTNISRRGIDPRLRDEVDALLRMGWGPMRLRSLLQQRYARDHAMLMVIPSARQLENRKAYLMRNSPGGWDLTDNATFTAWASARLVRTRERFLEVTEAEDPRMDELIILDTFTSEGEDGTVSFGVVVSSRRIFRNVAIAVRDQGPELQGATDGTYKLHAGGWTVIDFGSEAVVWERQTFAHRFVPWVYMFVRSETTDATAILIN